MKKFALIAVVCAFVATPAMAGPTIGDVVELAFVKTAPSARVNIVSPAYSGYTWAGIHRITVDGQTRDAFCIESSALASTLLQDYTATALQDAPVPGPAMGPDTAMDIQKVWSWWKASDGSGVSAAVAQCTVWELTDDGNFLTGDFQLNTDSVRAQAEALLAALPNMTDYTTMIALTNAESQDFGIPVVPAPGAALLASLGLGLIGHLRRRKTL